MPTYFIRDWDQHFETSQSRKYKALSWVALPNKHDGKSFRRLMRMENGIALYGAWVLIVQIASKCPTRGVLLDPDGPLTAEDIADKTGIDQEFASKALEVLSSERIGWIGISLAGSTLPADWSPAGSVLPIHNPTQPDPTEQNITQPNQTGLVGGGKFWEGPGKKTLGSPKVMDWAEEKAASAGISDLTDETRIWIFAAAERAYREGKQNPPGLFVSLINEFVQHGPTSSKLWQYRPAAEKRFREWKDSQ